MPSNTTPGDYMGIRDRLRGRVTAESPTLTIRDDTVKNPYWELIKNLAGTWGSGEYDSEFFKTINRVVETSDHLLNFRKSLKFGVLPEGKETDYFCNDNDLIHVEAFDALCKTCFSYMKYTTSKVLFSEKTGTSSKEQIIAMDLPNGELLYFRAVSFSDTTLPVLIYTKKGHFEKVRDGFSDLLWSSHKGVGLEMFTTHDSNGTSLKMGAIKKELNYVPNDDLRKDHLLRVSSRTKKFLAAGHPRKILFYGPPGNGKTTLAHELAASLGGRLVQIPSKVVSNFNGYMLTAILGFIKPNVVLLDDMDRDTHSMYNLLDTFGKMDQTMPAKMVVVGTANVVDRLDPALLRSGRFNELVEVIEPDPAHLLKIIQNFKDAFNCDRIDVQKAGKDMAGFSPDDVREVVLAVSVLDDEYYTDAVYEGEVKRVRAQRQFHAGDRCKEYLMSQKEYPTSAVDSATPSEN